MFLVMVVAELDTVIGPGMVLIRFRVDSDADEA